MAPLTDSSEGHTASDWLNVDDDDDDSSWSVSGSTTELLSKGSANHHFGTCIPCQFMKTKIGCNIGRKCNFCHFPHEESTRNSLRKDRRRIKNQLKQFERGSVWNNDVLPSDMERLSEGSAVLHVDTCISCTFMKTKLGRTIGHTCTSCHFPHVDAVRNSVRKERRLAAKERKEFEHAFVENTDAYASDTMAWLAPPPETCTCSEEASIAIVGGDAKTKNIDKPIQLATSSLAALADSGEDRAAHDVKCVHRG
eukprot:TRINITY_DN5734_c0_g3_i2.p1 TRINITY_DN5734_c0_g3~~TRINITY_DN5734_c0_g3_i2.p1  ORF type:complete len:253 (-),score=27.53 TRINITY_DN5734_c0_g3_i2:221-979(-)